MSSNTDWRVRSLAHVWQPCTQMQDHDNGQLPLIPIARADGVWLEDFEGKRYLDAVSSWWTNLWGHRHPAIVAALGSGFVDLEQGFGLGAADRLIGDRRIHQDAGAPVGVGGIEGTREMHPACCGRPLAGDDAITHKA